MKYKIYNESYKTKYRNTKLPLYIHEVVIGLLLSDGSLEKSKYTNKARLSINFSIKNSSYFFHLYNI